MSMSETYLFFDIESANCYGGEGHICSFGYVICDSDFNVLEMDDIVMNPKAEFDPGLFGENSRCRLAYTQEEFLREPDFSFHYERIKALLTEPGRKNVGFAVENDVGFIVCACHHFRLPQIGFHAYDTHVIVDSINSAHRGLTGWLDFYGVKTDGLCAHKSSDDAKMTMLLTQKVCQQLNLRPAEFFARNFSSVRTSEQDIIRRKKRAYKNFISEKISVFYNRINASPVRRLLRGSYKLAFSQDRDYMQVYEITKDVFENGGTIINRLENGSVMVVEDEKKKIECQAHPRKSGVQYITMAELYQRMKKPLPPFKTVDVSDFTGGFLDDSKNPEIMEKWMEKRIGT